MYRLACVVLIALISCKPQTNHGGLPDSPAAAEPALENTADSVGNARKDGTHISSHVPLDVKQQLPALLEVSLDRTHGLWQYPTLTEQDAQRIPQGEQGPYYLEADFNGDAKQDYAVQIVERDSAFIYAFLSGKNANELEEYLLEKHPLTPIEGKKRSLRYLSLARKDGKPNESASSKSLPREGITVGTENSAVTYVFEKGAFQRYKPAD
ncbi:hypothetical protein [Rufibacter quisquiliarum]|uniref:Lipoprotein n=1 Tax=Rufibacter quisquiliarum TaxID=1549639 RepID=A0A839GY40_9BACT|nr:hypothetical protein [Rufibacter quisquiliarum]MBA9079747.1 hypothetical protein [Rufibacter quisquiliarum]